MYYIGKSYLKKGKKKNNKKVKNKNIIRESEQLRPIRNSQTLEAIAENTKPEITPDFELKKYQEALLESYGNLKLDSLDTSGCAYNELKLWNIFIHQNVQEVHDLMPEGIHELPKDYYQKLQESGELDIEIDQKELQRARKDYYQQPIKSVLDVIKDSQGYRYLVVLGDPGSGKSTLLQYLALEWARTDLTTESSLRIPLLIDLPTYIRNRDSGQCQNFLEFCHQSSGTICHLNQNKLDDKLKAGIVLVMFDGLDEVFEPGKREDIITDIHRFTNNYPKVRVIVTSRVIGYKPQRLRDADFRHVMLQDLESEQIQTFIQQWHELTFTDQVDKVRKQERLQKAIKTSSRIRELAQNPLLLTMMAILNRNQELPRDRSELYNQSSRLLLHQWDVELALLEDNRVDPKTIDYQDKQQILGKVADFMQGNQGGLAGNLISGEDLERIIKEELKLREVTNPKAVAKVMINQLCTRNFIFCSMGANYYAFVHRTFLNYFCARELVRKFEKKQEISLAQLKTEVFGKHWRDEYWHEALQLIVGMVDSTKAGEIIEYLMEQGGVEDDFNNLFLAGDCLSEVRNRYEIKSTNIGLLNRVKDLIHYDLNSTDNKYGDEANLVRDIRTKAVVAVATHWQDHRDTLALLKKLARSDADRYVRVRAIEQLVQGYKDHRDTLALLKKLARSDTDLWVRATAIEQLAKGYKDHRDTLAILQELARSDTDLWVRCRAIEQLAKGYKDHRDTLALLKQSARSDTDSEVRITAIEQLAQGYKDHQYTLALLEQSARCDTDSEVRVRAIEQLVQAYKDHLDTLDILQELARYNTDSWVRGTAIEQLAKGYKDHRDTLAILKQSARCDQDWQVRVRAIEQLAQGYKDHRDTLALLQELARCDTDSDVRCKAIEQLAKSYKDQRDTIAILQELARSDTDSWVRITAIEQLAKGYKDHRDTIALLQQWARCDTDSWVRVTAIEQLAKGYKDHRDTIALLQQWARYNTDSSVRVRAIEQLAKGYKDHRDTIALLQQWARSDTDWQVRCTAIEQLAKRYQDHRDTLALLQESARSDTDSDVRVTAIKQLAKRYQDHRDTLALLQESARSDTDSDVRGRAIELLAQGWHDRVAWPTANQPWLFEFLCDRILHDPYDPNKDKKNVIVYGLENNPRQAALNAILKYYPNHSQTRSLLQDRAEHDSDPELRKFAKENLA
ncbi:HEAT repeat domain-containing protein [Moorena sp. SIO3B2]|uniref:HEAT repeat domain-containing protein n=2 Tax=unclassified Moorena TaxID=2683338 RepID=UPI0025797B39|nr:HEAT repeat domain-containing protein [Moorena sp. SIO3B2]